jgi:hypothetical protein
MMQVLEITPEAILDYAKSMEGQTIGTLSGGAPFRVTVEGATVRYIPDSTGTRRTHTPKGLREVCDRFNETRSFTLADYKGVKSANVTYTLALIRSYLDRQGRQS